MKSDALRIPTLRTWTLAAIISAIAASAIGFSSRPAPSAVAASIILGSLLLAALRFVPQKLLLFSDALDAAEDRGVLDWTEEMESRFNQLATMAALGAIAKETRL